MANETYNLDANGCRVCPQCDSSIGVIQLRNGDDYCEECGWPDSDFDEEGTAMETARMEKTLDNEDQAAATTESDVQVIGNTDLWQLLCKASSKSQGWMKSAKAMETPMGCIVQVTTQQQAPDGSYAVAEALTFVPGAMVADDVNGGRKLVQT